MRNQDKYDTNIVREILLQDKIVVLEDYKDAKTKILCRDNEGYFVYIIFSNYLSRHSIGYRFDGSNDHTIDNINHYLDLLGLEFHCVSEQFKSATDPLIFQCNRCGKIIQSPWHNINKNDSPSRSHLACPNCDGRTESLHALVLKQLFLHYYPDTIIEDKSFVSPLTKRVRPTDIVNHRLKIAIEIQSQWHDFDDIKKKDKEKKAFWIARGYDFYDPDIRDYSILEMSQLFFDIEELPDWINYKFSNKINIKQIQSMMNNGFSIPEIANKLEINIHRIYDAIYHKKLYYPKNYKYINNVKTKHISQESSETAVAA